MVIIYAKDCPLSTRVLRLREMHPKLAEEGKMIRLVNIHDPVAMQSIKPFLKQFNIQYAPSLLVFYKYGINVEAFEAQRAAEYLQDLLLRLVIDQMQTLSRFCVPGNPASLGSTVPGTSTSSSSISHGGSSSSMFGPSKSLLDSSSFSVDAPLSAEAIAARRKATLEAKKRLATSGRV